MDLSLPPPNLLISLVPCTLHMVPARDPGLLSEKWSTQLFMHWEFHLLTAQLLQILDGEPPLLPLITVKHCLREGGCHLGRKSCESDRRTGWGRVRGVSEEHPEDAGHVREGGQHRHHQQLLQLLLQPWARTCNSNEWRWQVAAQDELNPVQTSMINVHPQCWPFFSGFCTSSNQCNQ